MKRTVFLLATVFVCALLLPPPAAADDGWQVSGVLNSAAQVMFSKTPDYTSEDTPPYFGLEEYANIRVKAPVGEDGAVYAAFNALAAAGTYTWTLQTPYTDNFAGSLEVERLYLQLAPERWKLEAGLFRLAFGYGQVFSPSDFLNPRNPLLPDARPRAILGAALTLYPSDLSLLRFFAAGPKRPYTYELDVNAPTAGLRGGLSVDLHGERLSAQALLCYESPFTSYNSATVEVPYGLWRLGASLKADLPVGLFADALIEFTPTSIATLGDYISGAVDDDTPAHGYNGVSASAGLDNTFPGGKLYALAEYLYSSEGSVTSAASLAAEGLFLHRHYADLLFRYALDDYTSLTLSCLAGLEDASFAPSLTLTRQLFQGATLTATLTTALDKTTFDSLSTPGEFGPDAQGLASATVKLEVKF